MPTLDNLPARPCAPRLVRLAVHGNKYLPKLDVPIKTILEISGSNETGKSLLLKLIKRNFKKEHDPDLIHPDHDEAVVVLDFDDASGAIYSVTTTTTPKSTTREISVSDGREIDSMMETWLSSLTDTFLLEPFDLLSVDRQKREKFLRKVLPVYFTGEELQRITGQPHQDCDMKAFDLILAGAEAERSRLNTLKTDTDGAIKQLASGLLDEEISPVNLSMEAHLRAQELKGLQDQLKDALQALDLEEPKLVSARERKLQADIDELRRVAKLDVAAIRDEIDLKKEEQRARFAPQIAAKTEEAATARTLAEQQLKQKGLREKLDKLRADLRTHARNATQAQTVVDKLRDLQSEKWKTLPVKGLTYHDGEIFLDGKNLREHVNKATVYKTLFIILTHAVSDGMLPLVVTEGTEFLDHKNRQWFYDAAREAGFQVACEKVVEGIPTEDGQWQDVPLTVSSLP